MTKSRNTLAPHRFWTEAEIELLRGNYADSRTEDLAAALGLSLTAVYQKAIKLGLRKSDEYLASPAACRLRRGDNVGAGHRFRKGHVPANKGLRRPGWSLGRMGETQFKPGRPASESRNYKPIGSLRLSKDGYLERKFTDDPALVPARRWVGVHRLVWEAAHGPVPRGHAVCFLPGRKTADPALITLDALQLVTRQQLMARNTRYRYGQEINKVISLRAAITRQINKRKEPA